MSKPSQNPANKAPQFFIPVSYKGHQNTLKTPLKPPSSTEEQVGTKQADNQDHLDVKLLAGAEQSELLKNDIVGKQNKSGNSTLLPSPGGMLDLSLYSYDPKLPSTAKTPKEAPANGPIPPHHPIEGSTVKLTDVEAVESMEKAKKRRRFRRPRRNSKVDWLIRVLEDKRVGDDEAGTELEDLQMPRLRRVLNIIFVTLGVCFLLAVISVILYTTIATETETLNQICANRGRETGPYERNNTFEDISTLNSTGNSSLNANNTGTDNFIPTNNSIESGTNVYQPPDPYGLPRLDGNPGSMKHAEQAEREFSSQSVPSWQLTWHSTEKTTSGGEARNPDGWWNDRKWN